MASRAPRFQVLTVVLVCLTALGSVGYLLRSQEQSATNRLSNSDCSYLRESMHELVDWSEWSEAAFKRANSENKLIFLDMGATWSGECHAMARENYDDPDVVDLLNKEFVPIKVDVDARPDLHRRYEIAALLSGTGYQGGLPLMAIATPDGHVVYAVGLQTRNQLRQTLNTVLEQWRTRPDELARTAEEMNAQVAAHPLMRPSKPGTISAEMLEDLDRRILAAFDAEGGGFRNAAGMKPLSPALLEYLIARYLRTQNPQIRQQVTFTLDKLGQSALYDHLRGGFFNDSLDPNWLRPEFGKLLSHNAQMMRVYALAYSAFGDPDYRRIAYELRTYLTTYLWSENDGAFYSAQDSETPRRSARPFYTWRDRDLASLLSRRELEAVRIYFDLAGRVEFPDTNEHALRIVATPAEVASRMNITAQQATQLIESATDKMRKARDETPAPPTDRALYTHTNGMAVHAFGTAARVFNDRQFVRDASRAMDFIRAEMALPNGAVYHMKARGRLSQAGWLDDQVWAARGAIDLYQMTGEPGLLRFAIRLIENSQARFEDKADGGFYDLANVHTDTSVTLSLHKPIKDSPIPAANSIVANVLDDLAVITGDPKWTEGSRSTLNAFVDVFSTLGLDACAYARSVMRHLSPPTHVIVVGDSSDARTGALYEVALRQHPMKTIVGLYSKETSPERYRSPAPAAAFVCRGSYCSPPITDPAGLAESLSDPFSLPMGEPAVAGSPRP